MPSRLIRTGRAVVVTAALALIFAQGGLAQTDRAASNRALTTAVETLKASLDAIEKAYRTAVTEHELADLAPRVAPLRDSLNEEVAALEPRLTGIDARLKQLGETPPATAPPEDAAIAAERTRLSRERTELDAALKQSRLLALRADQLSEQLNERRHALLAGRLLARSTGLLDPAFWRDAATSAKQEGMALRGLFGSSWEFARDKVAPAGLVAAGLIAAGFAAVAALLMRAWRRRLLARPAETRFDRALAAVVVLVSATAIAPAMVLLAVLASESLGVLAEPLAGAGYGVAIVVALARFGRGVALALFAPNEPARRLIGFHDDEARAFAGHLTWAAYVLALAMLCNVASRATGSPVAFDVTVGALMSLAIAAVAAHLLARFPAREAQSRLPGLRVVLWLFVITTAIALVAGYVGFTAFLAGRLVAALALLCALYVVLVFIDLLLTQRLTGDTRAGRAIVGLFGITPRGLELAGMLASAALRIIVILVALLPVLGPWSLFATDVLETLRQVRSGVRVAGITISLTAILLAIVWLIIGVLAARGAQHWLARRFMPRTGIDPSLQHSVATLVGWALLLAAVALALAHLGIEAQQIALVAGALSVGIGFGLQSVVSNFICGIILLAERPIRVGDWVVVKSEEGIVRRISVRATEIETFDRASVIIPNSEFITGPVKNLTHSDTMGRIIIKVRAAFDSDVDTVRDILIGCACDHPQVLQTPAPRVFLIAFGDIALELELRCIVDNVNYGLAVKSDLQMAILQRFRAAAIKMPVLPHEEPVSGDAAAKVAKPGGAPVR